ncbi:hypothetical protein [Sphingorhabdus sp. SMR4y]|uniref:hypothetical protein n=1 Tax=Sphingorhabdus sp. SMR4y TaxID=2584094 RepID=UPI000B60C6C7|nr:hypothetical protein [Sphingorhabdus sp. SMR4y]ASK88486.1 hypothetical protein SPHFLASMR4Y_01739 [Sphingorhabdus sp. SMR4y]
MDEHRHCRRRLTLTEAQQLRVDVQTMPLRKAASKHGVALTTAFKILKLEAA